MDDPRGADEVLARPHVGTVDAVALTGIVRGTTSRAGVGTLPDVYLAGDRVGRVRSVRMIGNYLAGLVQLSDVTPDELRAVRSIGVTVSTASGMFVERVDLNGVKRPARTADTDELGDAVEL